MESLWMERVKMGGTFSEVTGVLMKSEDMETGAHAESAM